MHEDATCNDLQKIITQAINEIKQEQGENFNLAKINLAELERRTGLSRSRLRHLKENNFIVTPHGRTGQKATATVLTGYSGIIDGLLRKGVTNSSVCFERLQVSRPSVSSLPLRETGDADIKLPLGNPIRWTGALSR